MNRGEYELIKYIAQRFTYMILTVFIITTVTFFLMQLLPGTPINNQENLTSEQQEIIMEQYGLNEPVVVQYTTYMKNLLHGDLGVSYQRDNREVTEIIQEQFVVSALLGFMAMVVGVTVGLILGITAALRRNSLIDYGASVASVIAVSVPSFVFAGLLQYFFAVKWDIFPITATNSSMDVTFVGLILPTLALSAGVIAVVSRFIRSEMIDVMGSDYIMMAKLKGLSTRTIIWKHAIRNAIIPVLTILGPLTVSIMTGSLVVETIFAVPGMGQLFVSSVQTLDYPVIMGVTIFYSTFFVVVIFIIDILYAVVDPRIRIGGDL